MIKILFFASLREQLGCDELSIPANDIENVGEIIETLVTLHPTWKASFEGSLLCAVNQEMVNKSHLVKVGDEIAFFPPVTGG